MRLWGQGGWHRERTPDLALMQASFFKARSFIRGQNRSHFQNLTSLNCFNFIPYQIKYKNWTSVAASYLNLVVLLLDMRILVLGLHVVIPIVYQRKESRPDQTMDLASISAVWSRGSALVWRLWWICSPASQVKLRWCKADYKFACDSETGTLWNSVKIRHMIIFERGSSWRKTKIE